MQSRPSEVLPLLQGLLPKARITKTAFADRYCVPGSNPYDDLKGEPRNLKELNQVLTGSIMVRRLKKDVITDLPPKMREMVGAGGAAAAAMGVVSHVCRMMQGIRPVGHAAVVVVLLRGWHEFCREYFVHDGAAAQ